MVVALIALVVAASGTAIAAGSLASGDSLIQKGSLSGNRLRKHTLTGRQINLRKLGTVPNAKSALNAATATNAGHATNATNATNATTAANAANAAELGGLAPASYQGSLQWALVNTSTPGGVIIAQSGGISLLGTGTFAGTIGAYVQFPEHVKAVTVSGAYTAASTGGEGTPIAELCGGGTGLVACSTGPNDTTEAFVRTFNSDNTTASPHPFLIVGIP